MSLAAQYDAKAAAERGLVVDFPDPAAPDAYPEKVATINGKPLTITILGGDSAKVRNVDRLTLGKAYERIRKNKDLGGVEESEQEQIARLAAATIEWSDNWIVDDGEPPLVCNEANAKRLYGDLRFPWIVEGLQKRIDDRARFFSAKASK